MIVGFPYNAAGLFLCLCVSVVRVVFFANRGAKHISDKSNDGYYEAYWPRGVRQQRTRALAPRLQSLEGKTVAQLWDYLFKGDEVFELLEEGLKARFPEIGRASCRERV